MAYSIRCADSGANCPGSFTTETRDELLQHAEMHARTAHPELASDPQAMAQVATLVREV